MIILIGNTTRIFVAVPQQSPHVPSLINHQKTEKSKSKYPKTIKKVKSGLIICYPVLLLSRLAFLKTLAHASFLVQKILRTKKIDREVYAFLTSSTVYSLS
ncbi:unnamed protein product [Rhizophagus irregularis]|nr:unnamed protein product [Rhizophagus irregularis]